MVGVSGEIPETGMLIGDTDTSQDLVGTQRHNAYLLCHGGIPIDQRESNGNHFPTSAKCILLGCLLAVILMMRCLSIAFKYSKHTTRVRHNLGCSG